MQKACTYYLTEIQKSGKVCPCILVGNKSEAVAETIKEGDPDLIAQLVRVEEMEQMADKYGF